MRFTLLAAALAAAIATPVIAQDGDREDNGTRDTLTIGAGAATVPRYEGASDSMIIPAGAIRGRVSGIGFNTVGTGLYVDLIPPTGGPGTKFIAGPLVHLNLNRTSRTRTRDPQIVALGKLDPALDLGAHFGVSRTGVITSDYDSLTVEVAVSHDVLGTHDSLTVTPSIAYGTPLSRKAYVGISTSADYVGSGYGQTYFSVTPAQAIASGLPAYTAGDGFKSINAAAFANVSITGDLRHGLSAFALGSRSWLLGAFGRSPVVRDKGQWYGALGLAYTF